MLKSMKMGNVEHGYIVFILKLLHAQRNVGSKNLDMEQQLR
jgi:hypothetical protein